MFSPGPSGCGMPWRGPGTPGRGQSEPSASTCKVRASGGPPGCLSGSLMPSRSLTHPQYYVPPKAPNQTDPAWLQVTMSWVLLLLALGLARGGDRGWHPRVSTGGKG